jgi:hypothetical protein
VSRPRIKIFGERNTGTRYLQGLVERNLVARCLTGVVPKWAKRVGGRRGRDAYFRWTYPRNLGQKHSLVAPPGELRRLSGYSEDLIFLTLTKNPYSWLLSLHKRPYERSMKIESLEEFLLAPWPDSAGRERLDRPHNNAIEIWNRKNAAYLRLADGVRCLNLRYEDLVLDPAVTLQDIASRFEVPFATDSFEALEESTKNEDGAKDFAWYRDYYGQERWRAQLDARVVGIINEHLDDEVLAGFGYERIETGVVSTPA